MEHQEFVDPIGLVGQSTSRGRNLVILSPFGAYDTLLENSLHDLPQAPAKGYRPIENLKKIQFRG